MTKICKKKKKKEDHYKTDYRMKKKQNYFLDFINKYIN